MQIEITKELVEDCYKSWVFCRLTSISKLTSFNGDDFDKPFAKETVEIVKRLAPFGDRHLPDWINVYSTPLGLLYEFIYHHGDQEDSRYAVLDI